MKTMSSFKKSVLSIVTLSVITGSFISWDKYQPRNETQSMIEFYQNREFDNNQMLFDSMDNHEQLAQLAEDEILGKEQYIDQPFKVNSYSPELDDIDDLVLEEENVLKWEEDEKDRKSMTKVTHDNVANTDNVLFAFDSSKIEMDYFPLLNKQAKLMQAESIGETQTWQVVGYADLSGNYIYNSKLAKKRAQAVTQYLVDKGVEEHRLVIVSLGTSQPVFSERTTENDRLERRVEIYDYQLEVAILSEQFNARLEREITKKTDNKIVEIKTDLVEVDLVEKSIALEVPSKVDFSSTQIPSLTTVMEL